MRSLEEVCIRALGTLGLEGEREAGLTGTWCSGRKLAAQGVRATRWVTFHGLALNVAPQLSHFEAIVPCGIVGREVGSVAQALRARGAVVVQVAEGEGGAGGVSEAQLMEAARVALLLAFEDVFNLELFAMEDAEAALEAVTLPSV